MAVDVDLNALNDEFQEYEDYKNNKGNNGPPDYFALDSGETRHVLLAPPHMNMRDKKPWVIKLEHKRDLPQGTKAKFSIMCQRKRYDEPVTNCPACTNAQAFKEKQKARDDKWYQLFSQWKSKQKRIAQVVDITPMVDPKDPNSFKKKLPKCFLAFGHEKVAKKCPDCHMAEVCEQGVVKWYMPHGCWEDMGPHFKMNGNLCNFNKMIPISVTKTGKGKHGTKYSTYAHPALALNLEEISPGIVKRFDSKIRDLNEVDPPPEGDPDELKKLYRDFFEMKDLEEIDDDNSDDDDLLTPDDLDEAIEGSSNGNGKKREADKVGRPEPENDIGDMRDELAAAASTGKLDKSSDDDLDDLDDMGDIPY